MSKGPNDPPEIEPDGGKRVEEQVAAYLAMNGGQRRRVDQLSEVDQAAVFGLIARMAPRYKEDDES